MPVDDPSLETLLAAAVEITDPDQRQVYLRRVCTGERLALLQGMVDDFFAAGSLIDRPAAVLPTVDVARAAALGRRIGPYKPCELLGEGGMGIVYVAEQEQPVRRQVALKILKPGMDSREVISRFEAERQALALMDHPHIAKVLDAGTTETGSPYFVMELVKGVPINEHCDSHKLGTRERLRLFQQICQAVQHAHQKGIIHRDLKPSNVMVSVHDDLPVAKVIDFGVAKAISQVLADDARRTGFSQLIGTPHYMSPEQAGQSGLDIDTRSDVYSLGVMLYELLTGSTPLGSAALNQVAVDEMRRIIREVEPPRPSARISTLNAADLSTIAERRQVEPRRYSQLLRGELDWIVMKALEKDRDRRYESPSRLALDIQHFLDHEPVEACAPSTVYRIRKFAKRNKGALVTGALIASSVVLALLGTTWQAIAATKARRLADERYTLQVAAERRAWDEAVRANREAATARREADRARSEAAISQAVNEFVNQDLLGQASPHGQPDRDLKVRDVLARSARSIERRFADQPLIEASIRNTIGQAFFSLGQIQEAEHHLDRAWRIRQEHLGFADRETLKTERSLIWLEHSRGHYEAAAERMLLLVERCQAELGEEHRDTLSSLNFLAVVYQDLGRYADAETLHSRTLAIQRRVLGDEHPDTLQSMCNLALLYMRRQRTSEAESLYGRTLKIQRRVLGEEHPATLNSMNSLAGLYQLQGRYAEAETLFTKTMEIQRRVLGDEHSGTMNSLYNLTMLYKRQGRYADAEPLVIKTLETQRRVLGEEHPATLASMQNLATLYRSLGRHAEAEPLLVRTLELRRRVLGEEHPLTLASIANLAMLYGDRGRYAEAEPLAIKALELRRRVLGEEDLDTLNSLESLAVLYQGQRRFTEAEPLLSKVLEIRSRLQGNEHPETLTTMNNLAVIYHSQSRLVDAESLYHKTLETNRRTLGDEHPQTLTSMNNLAALHRTQRRFAEAETLFTKVLEIERRVLGDSHPNTVASMNNLAAVHHIQNRYAEAESLYVTSLGIRRRVFGEDHPDTLSSFHNLATLYEEQGRYAEAEPLLTTAFHASRRALGEKHPNTLVAMTRLGKLYLNHDRRAELESLTRGILEIWQSARSRPSRTLVGALLVAVRSYCRWGKYVEVEPIVRECLTSVENSQPGSWERFRLMSLLGECLAGQACLNQAADAATAAAKWNEAEGLLLAGFEGLYERLEEIPYADRQPSLTECRDGIVRLYEARGEPAKAAEWKARQWASGQDNPRPEDRSGR